MSSPCGLSGWPDMVSSTFAPQCDITINTVEGYQRRAVSWLEQDVDDWIYQCCANAQEVGS